MISIEDIYVVLGRIKTIEPVIISHEKGRGGYIRTLEYIPSSTIFGTIVGVIAQAKYKDKKISYQDFEKEYGRAAFTPAFPFKGDVISIVDPPPLPLRTIAREKNSPTKRVSVALMWARFFDTMRRDLLDYLTSLDYKDIEGFWYVKDNRAYRYKPVKITYTHVALDYRTKTSLEKYLYTVEALPAGETFVFKAYMSQKLLDTIKDLLVEFSDHVHLHAKIGAMKSRGYGLVEINIDEEKPLNEYIEEQKSRINANGDLHTIDFVSEAPPKIINQIAKLGRILYRKIAIRTTKRFYNGSFHLIRTIEPGSTIVIKTGRQIHGLLNEFSFISQGSFFTPSIIHINNPIHFMEVK